MWMHQNLLLEKNGDNMLMKNSALFGQVKKLLYFCKRDVWVLLWYACVVGFLALMMPVTVQALVNSVAFTAMMQPVVVLALVLCVALLLHGFLHVTQYRLVETLQQRLFVRLGYQAVQNRMAAPHLFKDPMHTARFLEISTIQKSVAFLLLDGISLAMQLVVGFVFLASYHPALLVLGVCVMLLGVWIVFGFLPQGASTAVQESSEKYAFVKWLHTHEPALVSETQDGLQKHIAAFLHARKEHFVVVLKQLVSSYVLQAVASMLLLVLGGYWVIQAELSLGQLVAAEVVLAGLLAGFTKLGKHLESFYDLLASLHKIEKVTEGENTPPNLANLATFEQGCVGYGSVSLKRIAFRTVLTFSALTCAALVFIKWQQTAYGEGKVLAFSAQDRPQTLDAPIDGQVVTWFVHEGSRVKKGDPIVELSDTDPMILSRLTRERDAIVDRIEAGRARAQGLELRIENVKKARTNAVAAAQSRVSMAQQREKAALQAREAAFASLETARLNQERSESMFQQGLISKRQWELAQLDYTKSSTEHQRAEASLQAAKEELKALMSDQIKIDSDGSASIGDATASAASAEAEIASASAELTRVEVRLARQATQFIRAPKDGTILRILTNAQGSDMVKSGDHLALFVPDSEERSVEIWLDGNDIPLVRVGQHVRLQFEGWPAVQFSGWPSVAVGTFGGHVALIDSAVNEQGKLRVLVSKNDKEIWPDVHYLRQGVRANGWVQFSRVRLGYELWRRFNAFPPSIPDKEAGPYLSVPKNKEKKGT
jgi:adhesin transport system membrane fusion protein